MRSREGKETMTETMHEFLVTCDVVMNDITDEDGGEPRIDTLMAMQRRALEPYAGDPEGLTVTLLRHWYDYGAPGLDYGDVALWLAPDEQALRAIYERLPLVLDMGRMTVQHVTLLRPAEADSTPRYREHNRHHGFSGYERG